MIQLAKATEIGIKTNQPVVWNNGYNSLTQELVNVMLDFPETPEGLNTNIVVPKTYKKVILVSGGMDSTIMWWLNRDTIDKVGLYVNFGHKYTQLEINAVQSIIQRSAGEYQIQNYPLDFGDKWKHIIPTRNFVLIALAEQLCSHEGEIWLGAVQGESAVDKGDKSDLFFRLCEEYIWRTKRKKVFIKDLKAKTKNDWLKQYLDETKDISILQTITCFGGTEKPCGKCQGCVRKALAMLYCNLDIETFFEVNPFIGGKSYIDKYKINLQKAIDINDFSHYSQLRCTQELEIIRNYVK